MDMPLWAVFGLISATLSAGVMLIQEKIKLDGFTLAFWNKVAAVTLMAPMVVFMGAPDNPQFYLLIASQAVIWVISDVIFFDAIPKVGAGLVSRILPASTILTFCLWFLIDPALWRVYMETPLRSFLVFGVLCASVFFAVRLRHCPISWQAVRMIWFVIFAAVIGPLMTKLVMNEASFSQGPFAYVFFEALTMVTLWLAYYAIRRPIPADVLFSKRAAKGGFMVGSVAALMVATNVAAISIVDNPGLIPAIKFTDTMIILLFYRAVGRKEKSDVLSGLGIVACAAALIILKSS
ncbi:MAG: hypothetical protein KDJ35_09195 [Alphaproteobacteria bacterium]|nr:hypothetical protein [Alphaproteobacteria bacterium]